MWLHGGILIIIILAAARIHFGWFRSWGDFDAGSVKLFLLVSIVGNLLGFGMTLQEENRPEEEYSKLERGETGSYEEKLSVSVDGGSGEVIRIRVPAKERPASEENSVEEMAGVPESEGMRRERETLDAIAKYNQEIRDPDYYYLPEKADGKSYLWSRPEDRRGQLLSGIFLLGGLFIIIFGGRRAREKETLRQEQMLWDYPPLIMKFTLLIQAGMSVRRAFRKLGADYADEQRRLRDSRKKLPGNLRIKSSGDTRRFAGEELLIVCNELESGVPEAEAYRHMGERCGQIRYRTFATLLVQNLQKGSRSLGDLLERESQEAWEERKRKARVLGETASTKLLFPMLLMLLVVMAVIMVPAFLAFWG